MRATVSSAELKALLPRLPTSRRPHLPVLEHVRVEATADGAVRFESTNLTAYASIVLRGVVAEPGVTLLPYLDLKAATGLGMTVGLADDQVGLLKVQHYDVEEYPVIHRDVSGITLAEGDDLDEAISWAWAGADDGDVRPVLSTVFFGRNSITGCNNYRVHTTEVRTGAEALVDHTSIPTMLANLPSANGRVLYNPGSKPRSAYVGLLLTDGVWYTHLVDGQFPVFERVMPREERRPWAFGPELRKAIRAAAKVRKEVVTLVPAGSGVHVFAASGYGDGREIVIPVPAIEVGEPTEPISFNPSYVDGAVSGKNVRLTWNDSNHPTRIVSDGRLAAVMPTLVKLPERTWTEIEGAASKPSTKGRRKAVPKIDIEPVRREVLGVLERYDLGPEHAAAVIDAVQRGLNEAA